MGGLGSKPLRIQRKTHANPIKPFSSPSKQPFGFGKKAGKYSNHSTNIRGSQQSNAKGVGIVSSFRSLRHNNTPAYRPRHLPNLFTIRSPNIGRFPDHNSTTIGEQAAVSTPNFTSIVHVADLPSKSSETNHEEVMRQTYLPGQVPEDSENDDVSLELMEEIVPSAVEQSPVFETVQQLSNLSHDQMSSLLAENQVLNSLSDSEVQRLSKQQKQTLRVGPLAKLLRLKGYQKRKHWQKLALGNVAGHRSCLSVDTIFVIPDSIGGAKCDVIEFPKYSNCHLTLSGMRFDLSFSSEESMEWSKKPELLTKARRRKRKEMKKVLKKKQQQAFMQRKVSADTVASFGLSISITVYRLL